MLKKSILITLLSVTPIFAFAQYLPWSTLAERLQDAGGDPKSLSHVQCFIEKFEDATFPAKIPDNSAYNDRCYSKPELKLGAKRTFAIIDYTKPSSVRRMFLVDRKTGGISTMAAAHGRFEAGFLNRTLAQNENSVKWAKFFSNRPGSNAPSSGFFFAGQDYEGKFGRSLALHGIETGVNDYACERAVVIHKHLMVSKNNAYVMSSGCPMISKSYIDDVVQILRGKSGPNMSLKSTGGLVFIYGPREKDWETGGCF